MPPRTRKADAREPRTRPLQERSRATVGAILDAFELLLNEQPLTDITMAAVGKRAGVGAGTLYAYFANIDALVVAYEERVLGEDVAAFEAKVAELLARDAAFEDAIGELVALVFGRVRLHVERGRAGGLRSELAEVVQHMDRAALTVLRGFAFSAGRARLRRPNLGLAASMGLKATAYLAYDAASRKLSHAERAAAEVEATDMLQRYLLDPAT